MNTTVTTYTCDVCGGVQNVEGWGAPSSWVAMNHINGIDTGCCSWMCVRAYADKIIRKQEIWEGDE